SATRASRTGAGCGSTFRTAATGTSTRCGGCRRTRRSRATSPPTSSAVWFPDVARGSRLVGMARARTVGVVSPGAMGSAVGHALREAGVRVVTTLDGRSERTAGFARRAEIECLPDLAAVARDADVILSIAPPAAAETIAADVGRAAKQAGAHPL